MTLSFISILGKYGLDEMTAKKFLYMLDGDDYMKLLDIIGDNDIYNSYSNFEKMLKKYRIMKKDTRQPRNHLVMASKFKSGAGSHTSKKDYNRNDKIKEIEESLNDCNTIYEIDSVLKLAGTNNSKSYKVAQNLHTLENAVKTLISEGIIDKRIIQLQNDIENLKNANRNNKR